MNAIMKVLDDMPDAVLRHLGEMILVTDEPDLKRAVNIVNSVTHPSGGLEPYLYMQLALEISKAVDRRFGPVPGY